MNVSSTRFGLIRTTSDAVIDFPSGLIGLEDCRRWILLTDDTDERLVWLQSVQRAEIAVALVHPRRFVPDFQVRVTREGLAELEQSDIEAIEVLAVVGGSSWQLTLNLQAPILIDCDRSVGRQVVASNSLPLRYALGAGDTPLRRTA